MNVVGVASAGLCADGDGLPRGVNVGGNDLGDGLQAHGANLVADFAPAWRSVDDGVVNPQGR